MHSLLNQILAKTGGGTVEDYKSSTRVGQLIRRHGVKVGPEFDRINALPRRRWEDDPDLAQLIDALTAQFKTPAGTQRLRPHQAVGLAELLIHGRFVADFPVGTGKTHITFLAPRVLGAQRPLLLVPANLIKKTRNEFRKLAEHWQGCRTIEILSYEKLSREKQADFLEKFQPDLILADEVYSLKNVHSGRTKRVKRFMKANPTCRFIPLSGTFWKNSVHDYAHISEWSMHEASPVPHTSGRAFMELQEWGFAIDVKPREQRLAAGVLAEWVAPGGGFELDDIRQGLATRRNETPGWVRVSTNDVDASLVLEGTRFDDYHSGIDAKFHELRHNWQTPTGDVFVEPQKLWAYLRSCSMGFEYYLDPKPPEEWIEARKAWGRFVRDSLGRQVGVTEEEETTEGFVRRRAAEHLDTELQVANACARGLLLHGGVYTEWKKIKPLYDPAKHRHTFWFDLSVVKWCEKWLKQHKGILFTPFIAFGQKMAEVTKLPYFAEQGEDKTAGSIEDYKGGPCIASLESNKRGRNLQDRWSRALVVGGLGSGPDAEQLIGRLHRTGQEADCVQYDFLYGCFETLKMLHGAREEAKFSNDINHKLILGDWNIDPIEDAELWEGPRWQSKSS